ncbi:MAG: 50S ribosomal protein L29 [Planctomycetota bacterium]|jgi:large subunit ribosomal protein L29
MKTSDIRQLPDADIDVEIAKRRKKLFDYRFRAGQEEKQRAGEIRTLRREIARMKTILSERRIAARNGEGAEA